MTEDIFDFAKKMELEGKAMYEEQIEKTANPGVKRILRMLADEEQNHYDIFDAMQKNSLADLKPISFSEVKNVFQEMKDEGAVNFPNDEIEFYEEAKRIEQDSEDYYRNEAEGVEDDARKEKILAIAEEEHKHVILMENFIEMLKRPQEWIENAEFNHLDEY